MIYDLRWLVEMNEHGHRYEPELQYCDEDGDWVTVPIEEVRVLEVER